LSGRGKRKRGRKSEREGNCSTPAISKKKRGREEEEEEREEEEKREEPPP